MRLLALILLLFVSQSVFSLSDPTRPASYSGPAPGGVGKNGLVVSAILHSKHRKIAVINGKSYAAGDEVLGTEILRIDPDSVLFRNSEGDFDVALYDQPGRADDTTSISVKRSEGGS